MTTINLTPDLIAPADVRRPIADWVERHGIEPRTFPARNTVTIAGGRASFVVFAQDGEGWVIQDGRRVVQRVTVDLVAPFPAVPR